MNYKQWDINTVTAADFTIQITIPWEVWRGWQNWRRLKKQKSDKGASSDQDELSFKEYF